MAGEEPHRDWLSLAQLCAANELAITLAAEGQHSVALERGFQNRPIGDDELAFDGSAGFELLIISSRGAGYGRQGNGE